MLIFCIILNVTDIIMMMLEAEPWDDRRSEVSIPIRHANVLKVFNLKVRQLSQ